MKKVWIVVIILIVILAVGYLARHSIKSMLGMSSQSATPATQTAMPTTAAAVPSDNIYLTKNDATKGAYLTDFQGMTLYTYDKDTTGVSSCYGGCASAWPPYSSGATAQKLFPANITVITRTDGSQQFAWKGMPLYYYATDQKAGDITGDGVGGVWHIVKP